MHRAPGYSVVREPEDECCSLWYDVKAKEAFKRIWKAIALRYKAVTKKYLGYNLVNEPPYEKHQKGLPIEVHNEIMMGAINEIRGIGDERTIFVDGMRWGRDPLVGLCIPGVVQSCRAYDPAVLTHHGVNDFPVDSLKWPGIVSHDAVSFENLVVWDRERLYKQYEIWAKMAQEYNVGVHCGEGGVYKDAPYEDAIHWFEDVMDILNGFNIGFAMWNLRGPFGIIDSQRKGCKYTDYKGHLLDKRMLEIMKR